MAKIFIVLSLCWAIPGIAAEKVILQAGETFLEESHRGELEKLKASKSELRKAAVQELHLKVKDTLRFTNEDSVAHNVYSEHFDLKNQNPGEQRTASFDKPGEYQVKCMIHPKMKFKVKVD